MKKLLVLASVLVVLAGCQTTQQVGKSTAVENTAFMRLWTTYSECQSSTDLEAMRAAARQLRQAATTPKRSNGFVLPLPKLIARLVSTPPTRLAVDPKAMAAACTLYTGNAALEAGRNDVAAQMFWSVIDGHPQAEYAYYVEQARLGFAQAVIGPQVSIRPLPTLVAD